MSVAVATTKVLVANDLVRLRDASVVKQLAQQMLESLCTNLTLATVRDQIKTVLHRNMQTFMQMSGLSIYVNEQSMLSLAEDNIEFAATILEKIAIERALVEFSVHTEKAFVKLRSLKDEEFPETEIVRPRGALICR